MIDTLFKKIILVMVSHGFQGKEAMVAIETIATVVMYALLCFPVLYFTRIKGKRKLANKQE